jgi:hypothetical protein
MLINHQITNPNHRDAKRFRRRFAIPYAMFYEIQEAAKTWTLVLEDGSIWKADHGPFDAAGRPTVPLNLKVLGVFRILAKGSNMDAISELAGMHESICFIHSCENFLKSMRTNGSAHQQQLTMLAKAWTFTKDWGSPVRAAVLMSRSHVHWGMWPAANTVLYTGKELYASIAYQVAVDGHERVLSVTEGHPGSRNDRTIIRTDKFMMDIYEGRILKDIRSQIELMRGRERNIARPNISVFVEDDGADYGHMRRNEFYRGEEVEELVNDDTYFTLRDTLVKHFWWLKENAPRMITWLR